ncbi:helix-turn-helix domain-containing protein, partial [Aeromonas salmonicida]|uniref:helix-turn-helix domain-containing protein n=1 Tax=Aeromonas salmonicida TaxID=645 RepID=UPI0012D89EAB
DWQIAQQRFAAISPLVGKLQIGRDEAERRAKELNIDPSTLYRWLQRCNAATLQRLRHRDCTHSKETWLARGKKSHFPGL